MKKGLLICGLICTLLLLCSCGKGTDPKKQLLPPVIPTVFETDMTVSFGSLSAKAHVSCDKQRVFTMTFQEPALLRDVKLTYDGTKYSLERMGLSLQVDPNDFPETGFGPLMTEAFNTALDLNSLHIRHLEDGNWEYSGTVTVGDFTIVQDASTGFVKSLSVPDARFSAEFSNFTDTPNK